MSFTLSFKTLIQTPFLVFSHSSIGIRVPGSEYKHLTMLEKDLSKKNIMVGPSQNISNDCHDDKDRISGKPRIFDGENFDYWKDRIQSFFLAHDADLWDMVTDGYIHLVDKSGQEIDRKRMTYHQKGNS